MKEVIEKYYCDECLSEVNSDDELIKINYDLSGKFGHIGSVKLEVCDKCFNYYSQLFRTLEERINNK
jgi:hypothetical protein